MTAAGAARRAGSGAGRIVRAWRSLPSERRLAAGAAAGLFVTLFLPWYQETVIATAKSGALEHTSAPLSGWAAFSFVEASVLLVAAGVLVLLFERAEGRAFHLPGGDGWVITAAGGWTCLLIVWRIFDKQTTHISGTGATASGVEWGIFAALGVAAALTYAGTRIRQAGSPEPPLPEDELDFSPLPRRSRAARDSSSDTRRESRPRRAGEGSARSSRPPRPPPDAVPFPAVEPLADPPTLRFERRPPPTPPSAEAEDPTQVADEHLTMPLEDSGDDGRSRR